MGKVVAIVEMAEVDITNGKGSGNGRGGDASSQVAFLRPGLYATLHQLGLKAGALAWPVRALALDIFRPSRQLWLWPGFGLALAWLWLGLA
jgi:hypothetical protein